MKIWHISDTHGFHDLLTVPDGIDLVIFSGDCSNYRDPYRNEHEVINFLDWFYSLNIKYKVFVAGNHDSSIEKGLINISDFNQKNISYLENKAIEIEGFKIYGSPYSPTFGNWCFMKKRSKLNDIWKEVAEDTDIVITHTPPMSVLDIANKPNGEIEYCGCRALFNNIVYRIQPSLHLFGHIHNNSDNINQGTRGIPGLKTIFSNGSVMKDGRFGELTSNGNIFKL